VVWDPAKLSVRCVEDVAGSVAFMPSALEVLCTPLETVVGSAAVAWGFHCGHQNLIMGSNLWEQVAPSCGHPMNIIPFRFSATATWAFKIACKLIGA